MKALYHSHAGGVRERRRRLQSSGLVNSVANVDSIPKHILHGLFEKYIFTIYFYVKKLTLFITF